MRFRHGTTAAVVAVSAVLAAAALAGPPGIEGTADVPAHKIVRLTAKVDDPKGGMLWRVKPVDPAVPSSVVDWASEKKAKHLRFVAPPGKYAVTLTTVAKGADGELELDEAEVVVTVGGGKPDPAPPQPKPPEPQPDADPEMTALVAKLRAAYAADPAADKAASMSNLAEAMTKAADAATDATLPTVGALEKRVNVDTVTLVGRGKLPAVGVAVGEYLSARLPASKEPATPLTAELRSTAADAYGQVAKAVRKAVAP